MSQNPETAQFNQLINNWKNKVRNKAVANVITMTGKGKEGAFSKILTRSTEGKLSQSVGTQTRKDYGEIFMVGFRFPRHGVFVHKGVSGSPKKGQGWIMINGKVVRTAKGIQKGIRVPKDWLNKEIDNSISELADGLVSIKADAVVNATRAKIQ